jgi:prepilin-type N-terminal cleavage/methylation domain-containing protein
MTTIMRRTRQRARGRQVEDDGFTLVELMIAVIILPIVVGGLSVMLLSVLKLQSGVTNRVTGTIDAQVASALLNRDVQTSNFVTTMSTRQCGTAGTQILALRSTSTAIATISSYLVVQNGTKYQLQRELCIGATTTPSYNVIISDNVPSNQAATVTCGASITCSVSGGWIATPGVASVKITVNETTTQAAYTLNATPRVWDNAGAGLPPNPFPISPLFLLDQSACPTTVLQETSTSIVNVSGGSGPLQLNSSCAPSITLHAGSEILASQIITANNSGNPSITWQQGTPPPVTYGPPNADPFATLLTAPTDPTVVGAGQCIGSSVITCTPGEYSSALQFSNQSTTTFLSGNYQFDQPVTFKNQSKATFQSGTYYFKGGLNTWDTSNLFFNTGNYILSGATSGVSPTVALNIQNNSTFATAAGGALFYIKDGGVAFSNGDQVAITGENANYGVAIWDAGPASGSFVLAGSSTVNATYGGIYFPLGKVTVASGGVLSAAFIVSDAMSLTGGVVNVG